MHNKHKCDKKNEKQTYSVFLKVYLSIHRYIFAIYFFLFPSLTILLSRPLQEPWISTCFLRGGFFSGTQVEQHWKDKSREWVLLCLHPRAWTHTSVGCLHVFFVLFKRIKSDIIVVLLYIKTILDFSFQTKLCSHRSSRLVPWGLPILNMYYFGWKWCK